jgi:hypothetical protein
MDILIAPITGEKEVTLVHRDDLQKLYDLKVGNGHAVVHLPLLYVSRVQVDLNSPDLDTYPLLAFARIWRHVLKPGEILVSVAFCSRRSIF